MFEILKTLPAGTYVLDLGCADGSFPSNATEAMVIRADRDAPRHADGDKGAFRVQADAANLPFRDGSFTSVISNHSLEHFEAFDDTLRELRRIIKREGGSLFVAVPDASTFTDRIYRWIARGGGHVNAFTSAQSLARTIQDMTGLPHVSTRVLCSSLSFLNRNNAPRPMPGRAILLGAGYEWSLLAYTFLSRRLDRFLGCRTSVYGWALYFGLITEPIDTHPWVNVCIRCGSGCASKELARSVETVVGIAVYRCHRCGAQNAYMDDFDIAYS